MISSAQKAVLHIAKSQLGLDREMYEAILEGAAGVRSSIDLDQRGFTKVMHRLEELGFKNQSQKQRRFSKPHEPLTRWQQQKIQDLYAALGWTDQARQMGFSRRQCGRSWPQTRIEANKVIEGLKAIHNRQKLST